RERLLMRRKALSPSPHGLGCGGGRFRGLGTGKGRPSRRSTVPAVSPEVAPRGIPPAQGIPPPPALSARRRAAAVTRSSESRRASSSPPVRRNSRDAAVATQKPAGTRKPARVSSPRFAPFPPTSGNHVPSADPLLVEVLDAFLDWCLKHR